MKSIIMILIAVAADQFDEALGGFLGKMKQYRNWGWLHQLATYLERTLGAMAIWNGPVGVLVTAVLPIVVIGFVYGFISKPLFGLFGIIVSILILIYCMGPLDLMPQLRALANAITSGNAAEASQHAQAIAGSDTAPAGESQARVSAENALIAANDRAFAPICWFAVLGWPGALLYRLVSELRRYKAGNSAYTAGADLVHAIMNWLPARLSALAYALSGNISNGLKQWQLLDTIGLSGNYDAIKNAGMAALQTTGSESDQIQAVTAMLQKAMFVFIGLLFLFELIALMM